MKRAAIRIGVFVLAIWAGMAAMSDEPTRIVDLRVGQHPSYDRMVIELERPVDIRRVPGTDPDAFVVELGARPLLPHQTLETQFKRMGTVVIEGVPAGARIQLEPRPRRVRVFRLSGPPRLVMDFADPGSEPFRPPSGLDALAESEPPPPEKEVAEVPSPPPISPPPEVAEPESAAPPPEAEVLPEGAPTGPPETEAPPEGAVAGLPEAEPPPPATAPSSMAEPPPEAPETEAVTDEIPVPAPASSPPAAKPMPQGLIDLLRLSVVTALACLLVVALGIALMAWRRMRVSQRRQAAAQARASAFAQPRAPETIMPEEVVAASDRVDILDKRIDEEVRARMHFEERLTQLQEELKVMRDRLQRVTRRGGEGSG